MPVAIAVLVSAGLAYRVAAFYLSRAGSAPISLPVALEVLPFKIGHWSGEVLPIPDSTQEYMRQYFADDFLSRRYTNLKTGRRADVYVVYCASRPAAMLGHRPRVCYPANGWVHDSTEPSQFLSDAGEEAPCLIHRFHKPAPANQHIVVLNFYVLSGRVTRAEDEFSDLFDRRPNISGNPARYVAQVQVSSVFEQPARALAAEITPLILDYLPDETGQVKAAGSLAFLSLPTASKK